MTRGQRPGHRDRLQLLGRHLRAATATASTPRMATGGKTYLIEGSVAERTARVLHENVECPSLSPDGTRIAYKSRTDSDDVPWRLHRARPRHDARDPARRDPLGRRPGRVARRRSPCSTALERRRLGRARRRQRRAAPLHRPRPTPPPSCAGGAGQRAPAAWRERASRRARPVTPRKSTTSAAPRTRPLDVELRMHGDDDRDVGVPRARRERPRRQPERVQLGHERVVVARARRRCSASRLMILIAGDSRRSPTPAL